MVYYDKYSNPVQSGDILRFDNNIDYIVYLNSDHLVLQNLRRFSPPLRLDKLIDRGNKVQAIKVANIDDIVWIMEFCVVQLKKLHKGELLC